MGFVQPRVETLRGVTTTFAALAVLATAFRTALRVRKHRFWWDDAWAIFSACAQLMLITALWIRTDTPEVGPLHHSRPVRVVAYWIVTMSFTATLWSARMSILVSIIRITPSIMRMRRWSYFIVALFGAMWAGLLIQKTIICSRDRSWYHLAKPQCPLGHQVASFELTTDFVSDAILLALPFRLLWNVAMPKPQRRLLFSVFAASILVTLVSIVHAYFVLGPSGLSEALTANVEASVSLIVCNLAVIATWAYRLVRGGSDDGDTTRYVYDSGSASRSRSRGGAGVNLKRLKGAPSPGAVSALRFASTPGESRLVFSSSAGAGADADDGVGKSFTDTDGAPDERDEKPFAQLGVPWAAHVRDEEAGVPRLEKGVVVTQETYTRE